MAGMPCTARRWLKEGWPATLRSRSWQDLLQLPIAQGLPPVPRARSLMVKVMVSGSLNGCKVGTQIRAGFFPHASQLFGENSLSEGTSQQTARWSPAIKGDPPPLLRETPDGRT